eukprot:gene34237-40047_t
MPDASAISPADRGAIRGRSGGAWGSMRGWNDCATRRFSRSDEDMTKTMIAALALFALPLAACGGNGDGKLAKQVEKAADNRADAMEANAKDLEQQAKQERKIGEDRAD